MKYEKHVWENGETMTSAKLNHIEDGIEAATIDSIHLKSEKDKIVGGKVTLSNGKTIEIFVDKAKA